MQPSCNKYSHLSCTLSLCIKAKCQLCECIFGKDTSQCVCVCAMLCLQCMHKYRDVPLWLFVKTGLSVIVSICLFFPFNSSMSQKTLRRESWSVQPWGTFVREREVRERRKESHHSIHIQMFHLLSFFHDWFLSKPHTSFFSMLGPFYSTFFMIISAIFCLLQIISLIKQSSQIIHFDSLILCFHKYLSISVCIIYSAFRGHAGMYSRGNR